MAAEGQGNSFQALLLEIANELSEKDFKDLTFLCEDDIPQGPLSGISTPLDLFKKLRDMGKINRNDATFLEQRLGYIHRQPLQKKLHDFVNSIHVKDCSSNSSGGKGYGLPEKETTIIGRDPLVQKIKDMFIREQKRMLSLTAPPGFGKTCVATLVGHSMMEHGFQVIFISLQGEASCSNMCSSILRTSCLGNPSSDDVIEQTKTQLLSLKGQPWLLILDNAEDIQNSSCEFQSFIEFLGSYAKNLKIFVGTRKNIQTKCFQSESITLPQLDNESSSRLLLDFANEPGLRSNDIEQLAIQCAGVPLLIKIAAGKVKTGYDPTKLALDLQNSPFDVLNLKGDELLEYLSTSIKVFLGGLSKEQLVSLVRLSCFPAEFTADVAAEIFFDKEIECRGMLSSLCAKAFLQFSDNKYSLHPLIQTFCREDQETMKCHKEGKRAIEKFSYYYFEELEKVHRQFVGKECETALQHFYCFKMNLQQAVKNALESKDIKMKRRCIDAFNGSVNLLGKVMLPSHCLKVYQQLYDEAVKLKDKRRMSECLVSIGFRHMCNVNHDKFCEEAFEAFKAALHLWGKLPYTEAYAHGLSKLGLCYVTKGEVEKGKKLINDAIQIRHRLGNKVLIAASYCDKAIAARMCQKYEEAISMFEKKCLPVYKEHLGDHPWVASLLNYLSKSHQALGCLDRAIEYNKQSLYIREKLLKDHQDTARSYFHLGELFLEKESMKEAHDAFEKALSIQEKVLGNNEETAVTYQVVQDILVKMGKKTEEHEMRERAESCRSEVEKMRVFNRQTSMEMQKSAYSLTGQLPELNALTCMAFLIVLIAITCMYIIW